MEVLHVSVSLSRLGGGVTPVLQELAKHQASAGIRVRVAGLRDAFTDSDGAEYGHVPCYAGRHRGLLRSFCSPDLNAYLKSVAQQVDIVHIHGVWDTRIVIATRIAIQRNIRLLISPHGMLEPWALNHRKWKKRVAMVLYQRKNLARASCLHALCGAEASNLLALGLTNPIAIVPNGIDLAPFEGMPSRRQLEGLFADLKGKRLMLFLGRIHSKKGLPHTILAWANLAGQFPEWDLVVAGWDQGGHEDQMRLLARSLGITRRVHFVGEVEGESKYALLGNSEIFVLSSFSEGFSMAILEAMAARLPVLLTPGCNFPEAVEAGAAVSVEPNEASTAAGLNRLLSMSDEERRERSERGRALVERDYTWNRIAGKMLETYEYILGRKPRPDWVKDA